MHAQRQPSSASPAPVHPVANSQSAPAAPCLAIDGGPGLAPTPRQFLIATAGTAGDMHPFLALGMALQRRGHTVLFLGSAVHEAMVVSVGLAFSPLGTVAAYEAVANDPRLWNPRTSFSVFWRGLSLHRLGDELMALPATLPITLLVHPLLLPAAALARARRPGVRVVAAWLAPANLRSCCDPMMVGPLRIPRWLPLRFRRGLWRHIDRRFIDPVALPGLNPARVALGLPPLARFWPHLQEVPDLSITLFPAWFAATLPDWPQPLHGGVFPLFEPQVDATLCPELVDFLAAGAAPIVFTLGTGHRHAARFLALAVQVAQQLGRRAILLTANRSQAPATLPATVLCLTYVPLRQLLPRVAALVHHGGIGTTAEALRAGVPQLVLPSAFDQFDNAQRVEALGVGRAGSAHRLRAGAMRRALRALLGSPDVAKACTRVAALLAGDADVGALCPVVEALD